MKNKRKKTLISTIILFASLQSIHAFANDVEKDVAVGFDSTPSTNYYQMEVIILGNGSVYDGTQKLREQVNIYHLKNKEHKKFRLVADKKHRIKSIIYDFSDITNQLNQTGEIEVASRAYNSSLIITFEKDINDSGKPNPKPDLPPVDPSTPGKPNPPKDIIIIIDSEVELGKLKDGNYEDVIRSLLYGTSDYKIISHNIKNKVGSYEVLIQLKDGSLRKLKINIIPDKKPKEVKDNCEIHIIMSILLFIYLAVTLGYIFRRHRQIKGLERSIEI